MKHTPLINDDEWQALRGLASEQGMPSASMRQAWHWYNTRVLLLSVIVFGFAGVLLGFHESLVLKLGVAWDQEPIYRDYFVLRGWLLIAFGLVGLWSWFRDWRVVQVQGAFLLVALITFAIDSVLIYAQDQSPGLGFAMSLLARLIAIACMAMNVWRADALPPLAERRWLWWHGR